MQRKYGYGVFIENIHFGICRMSRRVLGIRGEPTESKRSPVHFSKDQVLKASHTRDKPPRVYRFL